MSEWSSVTAYYEQRALALFRAWYRQEEQPTIAEVSAQTWIVARNATEGVTAVHVISLLQEHSDWVARYPQERFDSDGLGRVSVAGIVHRLLMTHLNTFLQKEGVSVIGERRE